MDTYREQAYGKIYSARPLSEAQLTKFEEETGALLREKVQLKNKVDPSLLGGVKIMVDGKLIDASLRSQLKALEDKMKKL